MQKVLNQCLTIKKISVLVLGVLLAFTAYQHFWSKPVAAQSTTTTRIYLPWVAGDDAGYTSLLMVQNTSLDPYGTTPVSGSCTADVIFNGTAYSGSLGTVAAGADTTYTSTQIVAATSAPLTSSGTRGYMFLTCNMPYVHAQSIIVNPSGGITFVPGYIVPPNRGYSTGPEQLLQ
jgi:hypothetical protein